MLKKMIAAGAVTVASAGVLMFGAGAAYAGGDEIETSGNGSILGGNQIVADLNIPVNVCGNTISVIGLLNPAFGNTCVNA